jgi:FkbM family methyltransferase
VLRAPGSALTVAELEVSVGHGYVRRFPGCLFKGWLAGRYLNPYLRDHPRVWVADSRFGARFVVDSRDLIQRYIGLFGVWVPHMTAWLEGRLGVGDVFVDVGANVGYFAVLGSRLVGPTSMVVAVEASPTFHSMMLRNVGLNGCGNVRAVNAAAADSRDELTFVLASSNNMGTNSMVPYTAPAESSFTIAGRPLTEILSSEEIAATRVIKIDVEGAEGRVIRGLASILDQLREDVEIAVEVEPDRMRQLGDDIDEVLTTMRESAFHVYRLPTDYRPQSHPRALARPRPPRRWSGAVDRETELVFSRLDAETLN